MRFRAFAAAAIIAILAPHAHAQAVTLAADTTAAPYHTVVHLTATAPTSVPVTFLDNGTPIATLTAVTPGIAVLGTATLPPGAHTLTVRTSWTSSAPVSLLVTPIAAALQLTPSASTLFEHAPLTLALTGLPPRATGTVTWSDNAASFATSTLPGVPVPTYQAFGDSITAGYTLPSTFYRYADLFALALGFPSYPNYATSAAVACDVLAHAILPNQLGPTQDAAPLSSVMIGSTDMDNFGLPRAEPNYTACHRAALAWLSIPREFKILPGDPAATILSGPWQLPPATFDSTYATLFNSSGFGAASFQVTSNGGPLYLWYLLGDHLTGAFTLSVDGTPTGVTYTTSPDTPIHSTINPDSTGFALLRFPVAPGPHTLRVDIVSGTVGILAAATPPSPGAASVHPTVLSADIPNQNPLSALATPATIAQFSADALADITLLAGDGLDIRPVPTHDFLTGQAAEFNDPAHPSILGQQHLAAAFLAAFNNAPLDPYLVYPTPSLTQSLNPQGLGQHTFTATYAGDPFYSAATATGTTDVVQDGQTITTLTAPATTFTVGQPLSATITIFPANPGALVGLLEGSQILAFGPVTSNTANLSVPSLAPGLHTLYAGYRGDAQNAGSISPPLTVRVLQNVTSMTLTGAPAEGAYGSPTALAVNLTPATATGTITLTDTYTPYGQPNPQPTQTLSQPPLLSGTATATLPNLAPGTHTLTATYAGDTNDSAATSTLTTVVDTIPTLTTLAALPAPVGKPSTFTATLTPSVGNPYPITGTVTFSDSLSSTPVQVAVTNSSAFFTSATLNPGTHSITAAYSGDALHAPSVTPSLAAVIDRNSSVTTLVSSPAPFPSGNPITLTATVLTSPATATYVTGAVLFASSGPGTPGQIVFGQAVLVHDAAGVATATLTLPSLAVGAYTVSAYYSSDHNVLASFSAPLSLQVVARTTTTTLTAPPTAAYGSPIQLSATVVSTSSTPTGLVRFLEGATLLGTVAPVNGTATFSTPILPAGPHTFTATFTGDSNDDPSTGSATLTITADPSTTTASLAQSTVLAGSPALVNIRVTLPDASIPSGTVVLRSGAAIVATGTLTNGSAGVAYATLSVPTSTAGTFPLTAAYSGDPNTSPSDSAALTYTVNPRIATGTLTLSATQVPPQTPVTVLAVFTSPALIPTGTVTFTSGTTVLATVPLDSSGRAYATLPSDAIGTYTVSATYVPTGVFTAAPIVPASFTVTPPLALAFTSPTVSMTAASTADATLTLTTLSGYQGAVTTLCTTPHPYLTCTVDAPATLTGPTTGHMHLAVARNTAAITVPATAISLALLLPVLFTRRRRLTTLLSLLVTTGFLTLVTGCGEGGTFGDVPAGTYFIQLTATAANTPTTATLTVNLH